MSLISITTCQNLGFDKETGRFFCKIGHFSPKGVKTESVPVLDDSADATKTVDLCKPLGWTGVRVKFGSSDLLDNCDKAEVIPGWL